jgi:hypothetical protein
MQSIELVATGACGHVLLRSLQRDTVVMGWREKRRIIPITRLF